MNFITSSKEELHKFHHLSIRSISYSNGVFYYVFIINMMVVKIVHNDFYFYILAINLSYWILLSIQLFMATWEWNGMEWKDMKWSKSKETLIFFQLKWIITIFCFILLPLRFIGISMNLLLSIFLSSPASVLLLQMQCFVWIFSSLSIHV